jgi:hypothetical protein
MKENISKDEAKQQLRHLPSGLQNYISLISFEIDNALEGDQFGQKFSYDN